ncbi:MAG: response regulator [Myxococcota bacterium]
MDWSKRDTRPFSIGLIDDDGVHLRTMRRIIELAWAPVHIFGFICPKRALEEIPGLDLDLVLSDLNMPGLDGFELCEALTGLGVDAVKFVLTGSVSRPEVVTNPRTGVRALLPKPLNLHQIGTMLDAAENDDIWGEDRMTDELRRRFA